MHHVMAQESDEVKKETQALMGATRLASGISMRFAANAEKHKDIRTKEHKNKRAYVLMYLCSYVLRVSGKPLRAPQYLDLITNNNLVWYKSVAKVTLRHCTHQKKCATCTQIFVPFPVCLLINECVCFYCHLTLFVRNKLIYKCFKSVRCAQSILHTPCIHLTHHTPLPRCRFGRMRWVLRHRDVEKSVGATDFSVPLCRNIALP